MRSLYNEPHPHGALTMEFLAAVKKLCKGPSTSGGITQLEVEKWGMKEVELRPHQLEGITWLAERCDQSRGCILGDEMGLGKTLQARDAPSC